MQGCLTFFLSGCSDLFRLKGCVPMSQFLNDFVVGIDVSSEFSIVAMLAPTGELIRKPFRIDHNPVAIRDADTDVLTLLISKTSRKSSEWASNKVALLRDCAQLASSMPSEFSLLDTKIKFHIDGIEHMQASLNGIEAQVHTMIKSSQFPATARRNVELLDEIPGVGFFTAATLIAEIGDFSLFNSPKALTAFFGLDPSVNQSGKFNGDRNKISKRGTRIGRRVLFTVAMASIRRMPWRL